MKECFHWKENDGMRIKATRSLLVLALAFGAVFGMRSTSRAADPIKVGGAFALTGDESSLDLPAANGAKLAVQEFNAASGSPSTTLDFDEHVIKNHTDE